MTVYGHNQGDKLLVELAQILTNNLRKGLDTAFRWGGDEFLLLMADSSISQAGEAIARMDEKIKAKNDPVSLAWGISMVGKAGYRRVYKDC
ncbi:MAG: diguanylate cyclase [Actinomycetota bacterium]|nr:diguanylate cyclase [Actinomycetota bacterium]